MIQKNVFVFLHVLCRFCPFIMVISFLSISDFNPSLLKLLCWTLLTLFVHETHKRIETRARRFLTNMPIQFAAIENECTSLHLSSVLMETRKREIRYGMEKIGLIDALSKKLCTIIPFMGSVDFLGFQSVQLHHAGSSTDFINDNYSLFMYCNSLLSTGSIILFLIVVVWCIITTRKVSR